MDVRKIGPRSWRSFTTRLG
uniref:Uncharacterized protein n=1 Tax=Romanomermis culicivorax TaxID=13658 RepID=A0A915JM59_ROMCU